MKNLLIITILQLSLLSVFAQQDYYVSPTGNDGNSGTLASPFATIQNAIDNVTAGSTIYILAGTYSTETIWLDNLHGTTGNIITIRNYQDDEVIVNGISLTTDAEIFFIENTSFITIQGLIIENNEQNNATGILIMGNCQDITINNCEIRNINFSTNPNDVATSNDNAYPLIVLGENETNANSNILISNNRIHDCRTGWSEGLAINGNVDGFEIRGNEVYNIANIGIDAIGYEGTASSNDYARNGLISQNIVHDCPSPYADCAGIYIDGARNLIIERNLCYNNQYGIEVGNEHSGTTTQDIIVRNNIVYSNTLVGLKIGGYLGEVTNCTVSGNTTYGNNTSNDWRGELELSDKLSNSTFENNIFCATNTDNLIIIAEGTEPSGISLNYNLIYHTNGSSSSDFDWYGTTYSFTDFQTNTSNSANSNFGNPNFLNVGVLDFHLQYPSDAINGGNPSYIVDSGETDFDGNDRIIDNIINCGALEGVPLASINNNYLISSFKIYPNPASDYLQLSFVTNQNKQLIKIIDITGKVILVNSSEKNNKPITINISNLTSGIYFIKTDTLVQKFIKK